ncbi:tripartite tricarboxylate transporter TctB family protein [Halovulum dunhuangense]|uniref:Tripartite tricarboxylate transporter TctB family protein n=1 Tax=Halovulum dunhuangense TaxID=1505036 RepID=A0A849L3P6_9RHOB|nr:tripartite tricarboxylate transporter TctB family protein [Halovulum dunhuangense]NNU80822.1 tripartite tricarboxylate transporter TctB family protein [Halovulum dunhuangense]
MLRSENLIAVGLMGLSGYFMLHATALPIGWVEGSGPGGGAFPFWLSAIMLAAATGILVRNLRSPRDADAAPFFDPETVRAVASVCVVLLITIALMPVVGAYVALPLMLLWYLRIFGGHGWRVVVPLVTITPVALFFFFEVTLRILLPKGITEPLFFPLYAAFF